MATHVALLRGMNLGGRRITNDALCGCFEELGFTDVGAFLASGNIVFTAKGTPAQLRKRVETGLAEALSYEVPTFIRSAKQVRAIAAWQPFAGKRGLATRGKLQVIGLQSKPSAAKVERLLAMTPKEDWLEVQGAEIYWSPRAGVLDSALDFRALETIVGQTTVRTKNTVERLVKKFFAA